MYTWDPQGNWVTPGDGPGLHPQVEMRGEASFKGPRKRTRGEVFVETPYKRRFPLGSVNVHFPYKTVTLSISRAAPVPVVSQKWPAPIIIMAEACFGRHIPCLWAHRARLWRRKQSQDPGRKAGPKRGADLIPSDHLGLWSESRPAGGGCWVILSLLIWKQEICAALCNAFQVHCWLARTRGGNADPLRPCEGRGAPAPRPGGGQGAHPAPPGRPALSPEGAAGAPDPRHASPHLLLSSVRPAPRAGSPSLICRMSWLFWMLWIISRSTSFSCSTAVAASRRASTLRAGTQSVHGSLVRPPRPPLCPAQLSGWSGHAPNASLFSFLFCPFFLLHPLAPWLLVASLLTGQAFCLVLFYL